jgi:protein-S-isoprenylcysteine O-methyltransferase Ste14
LIFGLGLWFLLAGYIIMFAFLVIQRLLRRTESSKTFRRGASDRGSTLLIGFALGIGLWLPLVLDVLGTEPFHIDLAEGLTAAAVMLFGLALRIWAATTLGGLYTRTLMVTENHRVVDSGPYSRIRHPAYLGVILLWSGFGVLSSNIVIALAFPFVFVAVYLYRISVEENMLVRELGDAYVQYQRRTHRLIPFLY